MMCRVVTALAPGKLWDYRVCSSSWQDHSEGAGDASLEEHLQAVRAKFSSTASAFGVSPKRPVFTAEGASTADGTPQATAKAPVGSMDF